VKLLVTGLLLLSHAASADGSPADMRWRVVLAGLAYAIAILAAALLRGWKALVAIILITVGAMIAIGLWSSR
jgi:hypothetical protein